MILSRDDRVEWYKYREECFKNNGRACEKCGKGPTDRSLHIHHPHYHSNHKPWQYDPRFCVVLCAYCHAEEHGKVKPKSGWSLIHSDWDEGSSSGETLCAECNKSIEWHNDMWHPQWGIITVGYGCAEKLGVPNVYRFKRLNTFLYSPRWRIDSPDEITYRHGEKNVSILQTESGKFFLKINGKIGRLDYDTIDLAKRGAYDYYEEKERRAATKT